MEPKLWITLMKEFPRIKIICLYVICTSDPSFEKIWQLYSDMYFYFLLDVSYKSRVNFTHVLYRISLQSCHMPRSTFQTVTFYLTNFPSCNNHALGPQFTASFSFIVCNCIFCCCRRWFFF